MFLFPLVKASKAAIPTPVLFSASFKVPVVAWPINKLFVKFVPASFPIKAKLVAALPSNKFSSVAVEVIATSSLF